MQDPSGEFVLHDLIQHQLQKSTQQIPQITQKPFIRPRQFSNDLGDPLPILLEHSTQGILFLNEKGLITHFNQLAAQFLNCEDPTTLTLSDDFFGFSLKEALRFGLIRKIFYRTIYDRDLEILTIKSEPGLILFLRDCTKEESNRKNSQRETLLKELGEIAATAAHEIRNALGGIRGYAMLLHRDLEQLPEQQKMAETLLEGVRSLEALAIGILHFSRPVSLQIQSVELGAFLKQLGSFVRIDPAFPKNISLEVHIPKEAILAPIDSNCLKSSLLNLIQNSLQAMPRGGVLTISLLRQDRHALITISDTGIGISEEDQRLLFSPFFTTKQKGTGLGLVEARKVIRAHGGLLEMRSQPEKGTSVAITLPLRKACS